MAVFPTPDDITIKDENFLLLPASPPPQPLLHLPLTATLFWPAVIEECCCTGSLYPSLNKPPNVLCLTAITRIWVGDQDPKCPWWFCTGYGAPEAKKRWWRGAPDLFVPGTVPLRISDCNFCLKSVPWVRFYFLWLFYNQNFEPYLFRHFNYTHLTL